MSEATPKVIVVGGGPVGITAAHALSRAGIDFVLLESRPSIVLDAGSNLVLTPTGLRALSQFGILPALNKASTPLAKFERFDHKGSDIGDTMFFTYVHKVHGCYPRVISRHDLMQILWDALPAESQSKMLTDKKVSDVRTTESGVVVQCKDGTAYEGTMVIGADGAYSTVRRHMSAMADADPTQQAQQADDAGQGGAGKEKEEEPFLTSYRCFWVRFPVLPGITPGDASESHGPVATTQFFAGETTAVAGVYEKLAAPTRRPARYTAADEAAFVSRWGHLPLTRGGGVTLAAAYARAQHVGLINLEEGVVDAWSRAGRAVLVGDAAHKFTPSTGAGCNTGIVDVVVLANHLHRAFAGGRAPAPDVLAAAFREYQDARQAVAAAGCATAGRATAAATWPTPLQKFVDLYVFSRPLVQKAFVNYAARSVAQTPVFDYIEGTEELVGSVPWANPIPGSQTSKVH